MNKNPKKSLIFMLLPEIIGLLLFFIIPFSVGAVNSFQTKEGLGFHYYRETFSSTAFRLALYNTGRLLLLGLPVLLTSGCLLALGINSCLKNNIAGSRLLLVGNILPMILPSAVIVFFIQMYFPFFHAPQVFWLLFGIYIWKNLPYILLLYFAGLQSIPEDVYQAAKVDGANSFQVLYYITLPLLKPYALIGVVFATFGVFRVFRESYLLFGNYPDKSVYLLQNYMNNLFYSLNYRQLASTSNFIIVSLTAAFLLILTGIRYQTKFATAE